MALGTKEDGHSSSTYIIYLYSSDYTVQTLEFVSSQVWTKMVKLDQLSTST